MNGKQAINKRKARIGRPPIHAAFSMVAQDKLLAEHPYLRQYLELRRSEIVRDVAGDEDRLSGQQKVLIDSLCSRLKKRLVLEIFFEKFGLLNERKLSRNILEPHPILKFYLSLCAGIDRALIALGLDKHAIEPEMTIAEIIKEYDNAEAAVQDQEAGDPGPIKDLGSAAPGGDAVNAEENVKGPGLTEMIARNDEVKDGN